MYVDSYDVCHRNNALLLTWAGGNVLLPPPYNLSDGITIDYVTDLQESTMSGYMDILVIVNRITKMAIYLCYPKDINSPELAHILLEHLIGKCGLPNNIVTDRGMQFTCRLRTWICFHMRINNQLSTALHPQIDGQSKRQTQTMEQYPQAFSNYEQENWAKLLLLMEFAYNNSVHASTRMTPFWASYHRKPEMLFKTPKTSYLHSENQADSTLSAFAETHCTLRGNMLEAQWCQTMIASGKWSRLSIGDTGSLSSE